jgi:hypothetical protein
MQPKEWSMRAPEARRRGRVSRAAQAATANVRAIESLECRRMLAGWTPLTNLAPAGVGTMLLMTDGTVMAQAGGISAQWMRLTPNASGSYVNGTWSSMASMSISRLYFASNILPDGRLFLLGGEYSNGSSTASWTNTGQIYNPATNTWSNIPNFPESQYGDVPSMLLPDGRVMCGSLTTAATYIYNPATNTWTSGAAKINGDRSDEESWVKLADDSVLSYDVFGSPLSAQRYVPGSNSWIAAGTSPVQLHTSGGAELGPAFRIPDGRAVFIGATAHNAIYNPATNSWSALNDTPGGIGANDAPGVLLPNGHIVYAAGDTSTSFNPPTSLMDLDPVANTITAVSLTGGPSLSTIRPFNTRMLMLPTGQMLFSSSANRLYVYTPDGAAQAAWRPTISGITRTPAGVYTLTGSQLNGVSAGASYGDDAEMDENYPIVRFTSSSGVVRYAKSFNWNHNGVGSGGATSVQFSFPSPLPVGDYTVNAVGAGIASDNFSYSVQPNGIWTGGGDAVSWSDAANWSNNIVPGPADDAAISSPSANVMLNGGTSAAVHSLTCAGHLTVANGSLSLAAGSQVTGALDLGSGTDAGTLVGAGILTITGTMTWSANSTMSGTGKTIIAAGGALGITGSVTLARVLENQGNATITWSAGNITFAGGTISNVPAGTFNADAPIDFASTRLLIDAGGTNAVSNAGVFHQLDGVVGGNAVGTDCYVPFNNAAGGALNADGAIRLYGGGTSAGTFNSSGLIGIESHSPVYGFDSTATLTGLGTIRFDNSGAISVAGTVDQLHFLDIAGSDSSVNFGAAVTMTADGIIISETGAVATFQSPVSTDGAYSQTGGKLSFAADVSATNRAQIVDVGGAIAFNGSLSTIAALFLGPGSTVTTAAGANAVVRTGRIDADPTATFDLADDGLVIDYSDATPFAAIRSMLASGSAAGAWDGSGINSSVAAVTPGRALGVTEAADVFGSFPATFHGQSIDDTTVLVGYTLNGDGNLDRAVDLTDFTFLAANFNGTGKTWVQGDYNYDGAVDLTDFTFLAANFNQSLPAAAPSMVAAAVVSSPPPAVAAPLAATLTPRASLWIGFDQEQRALSADAPTALL